LAARIAGDVPSVAGHYAGVHNHDDDEAHLDNLTEPVELKDLETSASGAMTLNQEWVAHLDEAELPTHVAGIDENLHHAAPDGGTAYA
jgi:hypothetical protein